MRAQRVVGRTAAPGNSSAVVSWRRQDANSSEGTSGIEAKTTPADDTEHTWRLGSGIAKRRAVLAQV